MLRNTSVRYPCGRWDRNAGGKPVALTLQYLVRLPKQLVHSLTRQVLLVSREEAVYNASVQDSHTL